MSFATNRRVRKNPQLGLSALGPFSHRLARAAFGSCQLRVRCQGAFVLSLLLCAGYKFVGCRDHSQRCPPSGKRRTVDSSKNTIGGFHFPFGRFAADPLCGRYIKSKCFAILEGSAASWDQGLTAAEMKRLSLGQTRDSGGWHDASHWVGALGRERCIRI